MKNKLLALFLFVVLVVVGFVVAESQEDLELELAELELELIDGGYSWLVNATVDEGLDVSSVEVYTQNGTDVVATLEDIGSEGWHKVYLTELSGVEDVFDLRVSGAVEFDYIVDPAPAMQTVILNSTTNTTLDNLLGYCNATDGDGDNLVYDYVWYNGSTAYVNGTLFKEGSISTGGYHTCGIRANDSRVLCWGLDDYGQLGDGTIDPSNPDPTLTSDSSAYSSVSTGNRHTCGIRSNDSKVLCWGWD
jgi:hypothetical protein